MYSSSGKSTAAPQCWFQHLMHCEAFKGDDIPTGRPPQLCRWSSDYAPVWAASTFINLDSGHFFSPSFFFFFLLHHHHHHHRRHCGWCTATGEIRPGPVCIMGFTGLCPLGGCSQRAAEEGIMWGNPHQKTNSCPYHRGQPGKYWQLISLPVWYSTQIRIRAPPPGTVSGSAGAQTECVHQAIREGWKKSLQAGKTWLTDTFTGGCGPSTWCSDAE